MGTANQSIYTATIVMDSQPDFPQTADRTALLGGVIITDIANISEVVMHPGQRESQPVTPSYNHLGAYGSNYGDSFIFERVWVQPLLIDVGFIVEDTQWAIKTWNASRFGSVNVTSILATNPEGTVLTYDPLPNTIAVFGDLVYPLEVLSVGPPLQDTTYKLTIDGLEYEIDIVGIRVLPFDLDPNWDSGIQVKYTFQSTIFASKRLNEQRRPLSVDSWFSTGFTTDASKGRARTVFNQISYGKDKVFGVPVFTEKINPTAVSIGSFIINTNDDLALMYNLNNRADFVILVDHVNGLSEVKLVNSVDPGVITLDQPVSANFQQETTYVYPCMFCYLKRFKSMGITDDLVEIAVDFEQYKS
ncbi:MAG: hypothetical protein PF503_06220 [Desulfobacula sp.]|jgi:hypothetical protein|nr:hypothetical protein [Desulfobacula sp.]